MDGYLVRLSSEWLRNRNCRCAMQVLILVNLSVYDNTLVMYNFFCCNLTNSFSGSMMKLPYCSEVSLDSLAALFFQRPGCKLWWWMHHLAGFRWHSGNPNLLESIDFLALCITLLLMVALPEVLRLLARLMCVFHCCKWNSKTNTHLLCSPHLQLTLPSTEVFFSPLMVRVLSAPRSYMMK